MHSIRCAEHPRYRIPSGNHPQDMYTRPDTVQYEKRSRSSKPIVFDERHLTNGRNFDFNYWFGFGWRLPWSTLCQPRIRRLQYSISSGHQSLPAEHHASGKASPNNVTPTNTAFGEWIDPVCYVLMIVSLFRIRPWWWPSKRPRRNVSPTFVVCRVWWLCFQQGSIDLWLRLV